MPLPSTRAIVKLNFFDGSGKVWQNILHYTISGSFSGGFDIAAAATAIEAFLTPTLLPTISADVLYLGLDLQINNGGIINDAATFPASAGTGLAGSSPNEVAAIVHWGTATPGRSGEGRLYLAGMPTTFIQGGRVTTAANTVYGNFATKLKTAIVDQGVSYALGVLSRKLDTISPVASFVVDSLVGTQRRRRPKR
jgi:hypothetical protein